MSDQVFIAGAGPTGLVLALWLRHLGVPVRIVDKSAAPGMTSRALAVQARTLEFYRQLGIAAMVTDRGLKFSAANLWARGQNVARVNLGDLGDGLSAFPYVVCFPQDEHERLLIDLLAAAGVTVERGLELVGFQDIDDGGADDSGGNSGGVRVSLRRADGTLESHTARYLAGCDGAHSAVRTQLATGFDGGTYAHLFYVADVRARGPVVNGELHVALDDADFLAVFPMKNREGDGPDRVRLIGTVRSEAAGDRESLAWDDVSPDLLRRLRIDVQTVNWFSTYRVHHRVAQRFRTGRVFLLGDAAHIHSPVGGQGMNTGIGDAVNLAWKLAAVLDGDADESLLDTYESERIAFARRLVATTDRMFTAATSSTALARGVRLGLLPRVLPPLSQLGQIRRLMFRTIAQIGITYRGSAISAGRAGRVRGGDRLPWTATATATATTATATTTTATATATPAGAETGGPDDNHASLTGRGWQVHIYGGSRAPLASDCARLGLSLHEFPWRPAMQRAGLQRDALYLVRPDGHVAWADPAADVGALQSFLGARGLRPRQPRG